MSGDPLYDHLENMKQPRVFRDAYHELDEVRHERDTLITALRECVVALERVVSGYDVKEIEEFRKYHEGRSGGEISMGDVIRCHDTVTNAKSTLERYKHEHP